MQRDTVHKVADDLIASFGTVGSVEIEHTMAQRRSTIYMSFPEFKDLVGAWYASLPKNKQREIKEVIGSEDRR